MHLGVHVNKFSWPGGNEKIAPTLTQLTQNAEAAGFYSLSVMDHYFQIPPVGPAHLDMLEGYTTLGYIAAKTTRLRLGTVVSGVTYRHPGLLLKEATTLDVLSEGRTFFGVGAAWFEEEHVGLGVPFPPLKERFERLEELLQLTLRMWSGDETPFQGKHYQLQHPMVSPRPIQKPHPPIMVGGGGEQKTLKLVAKYADICNLFEALGVEGIQHKLEVLREHCDAIGRPYDQIVKSVNGRINLSRDGQNGSMTPAQVVDRFAPLRDLGITWVNLSMPNAHEPAVWDLLGGEVVPALEKL